MPSVWLLHDMRRFNVKLLLGLHGWKNTSALQSTSEGCFCWVDPPTPEAQSQLVPASPGCHQAQSVWLFSQACKYMPSVTEFVFFISDIPLWSTNVDLGSESQWSLLPAWMQMQYTVNQRGTALNSDVECLVFVFVLNKQLVMTSDYLVSKQLCHCCQISNWAKWWILEMT